MTTAKAPKNRCRLTSVAPSRAVPTMAQDVRRGLTATPRVLHPKYFYDERGSQLFDQICDTPEYYLTRVETELLTAHAAGIVALAAPDNMLELGAGASRKTRLLLDRWCPAGQATYLPFDVSEEMLMTAAAELAADYPDLSVHALAGDYTAGLEHVPGLRGRTLWMFIGSTLGNFEPREAQAFVAEIANRMKRGDSFLLGADLHKSEDVLEPAYNDAQGLTAAFNLNVLAVINRELRADFRLERFSHLAYYCQGRRRIEMHLVSDARQRVTIGALDLVLDFEAGERIRTEISRKFLTGEIRDMLEEAGLQVVRSMVHERFPFALTLARKP